MTDFDESMIVKLSEVQQLVSQKLPIAYVQK